MGSSVPQRLHQVVGTVGAGLFRLVQVLVLLRAARCLGAVALLLVAVLVAIVGAGAGTYATWRSAAVAPAVDPEQAWRYLVVCAGCGHREKTLEHPALDWLQQGGLLQCPRCGEFKAAWYRRGSQSLPPGGWQAP